MHIHITPHHLALTSSLRNFTLSKIATLSEVVGEGVATHVVLRLDPKATPDRRFSARLRLAVRGTAVFVSGTNANLHAAIDQLVDKAADSQEPAIRSCRIGSPTVENGNDATRLRDAGGESSRRTSSTSASMVVWMRRAQRAARIGTWDWNLQTGVTSWTEEAWTVFGRKPGEFTLNYKNWLACVHPDDRAASVSVIEASRQSGRYYDEYRVLDSDGTERWVESRGELVFDSDGQPVRMLGTALDITERKHTEMQLADAQRQLQLHAETLEETVIERTARLREIVTELEALSFSIAHDMRAPLRAMQGFATVLMSDHAAQLDGIARSYLERIAVAARRMDGFIVDILNYSNIVRGKLDIMPVDAGKLIHEIIASYPMFADNQGDITVETPFPGVLANEAALTQVVSNLLDNAVKFVAPGVRPRVRVRAGKSDGAVRLWFEDNGIGIPRDSQPRLFEIFVRLNRPDHYEGRGIGLAVVRKSVERMGGSVGMESEPGSGSRFWIQLKAAEES